MQPPNLQRTRVCTVRIKRCQEGTLVQKISYWEHVSSIRWDEFCKQRIERDTMKRNRLNVSAYRWRGGRRLPQGIPSVAARSGSA